MIAASNPWVEYQHDQHLPVDKVAALVNLGGSLTAKDDAGRTALHWGASVTQFSYDRGQAQKGDVVQYLLSIGADKNKVDKTGRRPADWAALQGNTANLDVLNAWTSDTQAPEVLDGRLDLGRKLVFRVDFDETLVGNLPSNILSSTGASPVNVVRLDALGRAAATLGSALSASSLSAGNTRVDVRPNTKGLADGWYDVVTAPGTADFRDAAGNRFAGKLGRFWFLNGDANRDQVVDAKDYDVFRDNFGRRDTGFTGADFNFDGRVDLKDYAILRGQMGKILPPEPINASGLAMPVPTSRSAYAAVSKSSGAGLASTLGLFGEGRGEGSDEHQWNARALSELV